MATLAGTYKVNDKINLVYQALGGLSAAAPVCKIYDEGNASDTAKQSVLKSALAANEKAGGRYLGYFTPDAEGRWTVCIQDKNGDGLVSKTYEVCGHSVDDIGDVASSTLNQAKSAVAAIAAQASDVKSAVVAQVSDVKPAAVVAGNKATSALGKATSALNAAKSAADYGSANAAAISDVKSAAVVAGNKATSALGKATSALTAIIAQASDVKSAVTAVLNKVTSALGKATSAADYASAVATVTSPAMVS